MPMTQQANDRHILAEIGGAFVFLTRLPMPQWLFAKGYPDLQASLWAFPLVGLVVGLCGSLTFALGHYITLPHEVSAILVLIVMVIITGGLHEDGLADMADGFGSHKGPDEIARIMKDSLIGSFGTIALILLFITRWSALSHLDLMMTMASLPAIMAIGRFFVVIALQTTPLSPYASLGKSLSKPSYQTIIASFVMMLLSCLFLSFVTALAAFCAGFFMFIAVRFIARRKIEGLTGDVMGALIVLTEAAALIGILSYG